MESYKLIKIISQGWEALKKVNKNTKDQTIPSEFSKWVKAGGKTLQGLATRRISEAKLYSTGKLDFLWEASY